MSSAERHLHKVIYIYIYIYIYEIDISRVSYSSGLAGGLRSRAAVPVHNGYDSGSSTGTNGPRGLAKKL